LTYEYTLRNKFDVHNIDPIEGNIALLGKELSKLELAGVNGIVLWRIRLKKKPG
jgi:hypothetical protein